MKSLVIGCALSAVLLSAFPQWREDKGLTPSAVEAISWRARQDLMLGDLQKASAEADAVIHQSRQLLKGNNNLDSLPPVATAVGAAYEVQSAVLDQQGKKTEAIQLLRSAIRQWAGTSIVTRLQKNINLLTFVGKPMPALRETEWIGTTKPTPTSALRGKVLLLFFWAHWCPDCKAEAPVIARLAAEFESHGLVVIAPTQRYGYTPADEHATPAEEKNFIEEVFERFYAVIPGVQVPLSSENFRRFGASTTPTIVLVDRKGVVTLYHPGTIDETSLRAALAPLINS